MIRVVPVNHRMWPGWIATALFVVVMLKVLASYLPDDYQMRWIVAGLTMALVATGPAFAHRPRNRLVTFDEAVKMVPKRLLGVQARAVRGTYGVSVGVSWKRDVRRSMFFEIENEEEAKRFLRAIKPAGRDVEIDARSDTASLLRGVFATIGACCGIGYAIGPGVYDASDWKAYFALPAIAMTLLGLLVLAVDHLRLTKIRLGDPYERRGAVGRHLRVHARAELEPNLDIERESPPAAEPRFRVLVRGAESAKEWLGRVDALGAAGEGYRGDAPTREELRAVLADDSATFDVRLAAARVLVRKHEERIETLAKDIDPDLAPYLFDVASDDAPSKLERRAPLFRVK